MASKVAHVTMMATRVFSMQNRMRIGTITMRGPLLLYTILRRIEDDNAVQVAPSGYFG